MLFMTRNTVHVHKYDNQLLQFSHTILHFINMLIVIQDGFQDFKMFTVVALLFLIVLLTLLTSSLFQCSEKFLRQDYQIISSKFVMVNHSIAATVYFDNPSLKTTTFAINYYWAMIIATQLISSPWQLYRTNGST